MMGSKYEALKTAVLTIYEQAINQAKEKGIPTKTFLKSIVGDKADQFYMRYNAMRRNNLPLYYWDVKIETLEEFLKPTGYVIIPTLVKADDTETINKLEEITAKNIEELSKHVNEILETFETEEKPRARTRRAGERRRVEADSEFLQKLRARIQEKIKETEVENEEVEVTTNKRTEENKDENDLFDI